MSPETALPLQPPSAYEANRDIVFMTLPLLALSTYFYGARPAVLCLTAAFTAMLCDHLVAWLRHRPCDKTENSSIPSALVLVLLLPACGSGGGNGAPADQTASSTPGAAGGETAEFGGIYEVESPSQSPQESPVYQDPDAKLVRRAELYVETTEFDQAAQQLNEMVNQAGGYFESAAVEGGSYRNVNANRYGSYVIRVPEDAYTGFLQDAGELGYLASKTESTENISTQYYDTEARLKTLRTKQERLQALLAEAEVMEDIISLESALSDVEYEIEQYSSTMNQYDSFVSFSTIDLTLQEVTKVTEEPGETSSLGAKMAAGFSASLEGLVDGFQGMLIWISYHVFGLVVLAVIAAAGVVIGRSILRKKRKESRKEGQDQ